MDMVTLPPDRLAFTKSELQDLKAVSEKLFGMGIVHQWDTRQSEDGGIRALYTGGSGYRLLSITKHPDRPGFCLATGDGHEGACIPELRDILEERVRMS